MITGKWKKLGLLDCFTWIYPSMMHGDVLREIRCPYHLNNMQSDVCLWCQWWLITAGSAITLCDTLCYLFNKHLHRNKLQYVFIILFPTGEMQLHYFVCFFSPPPQLLPLLLQHAVSSQQKQTHTGHTESCQNHWVPHPQSLRPQQRRHRTQSTHNHTRPQLPH